MGAAPKRIDGARVLFHIRAMAENEKFGTMFYINGRTDSICGLAICRYSDEKETIYLFICDEHWQIIGDLSYKSVQEAIDDAMRYYGTNRNKWIKTKFKKRPQ